MWYTSKKHTWKIEAPRKNKGKFSTEAGQDLINRTEMYDVKVLTFSTSKMIHNKLNGKQVKYEIFTQVRKVDELRTCHSFGFCFNSESL